MSDLPKKEQKSEQKVVQFFDEYFNAVQEFPVNSLDAVTAFFTARNFGKTAAITIAQIILAQAKNSNVPVFELLDTLKGYNKLQLSTLVTSILNNQRDITSKLGFKLQNFGNTIEKRNILV